MRLLWGSRVRSRAFFMICFGLAATSLTSGCQEGSLPDFINPFAKWSDSNTVQLTDGNTVTVTASTIENSFHRPANMFSADATRPWMSRRRLFLPETVEFSYGQPVTIGEFGFAASAGRPQAAPGRFTLQGLRGNDWQTLLSVNGECPTQSKPKRMWPLDKGFHGSRFRLLIEGSCGDNERLLLHRIFVEPFYNVAIAGAPNVAAEDALLPAADASAKTSASSALNANVGPDKLLDRNPTSIWHRDPTRGNEPSWLEIDLGPSPKGPVRIVKAMANPAQPGQMFMTAYLHGSNDKARWSEIAKLTLAEPPAANRELSWHFENETNYRYYRLTLADGFLGGVFNSMGEIGFFAWPNRPRTSDYRLTSPRPAPTPMPAKPAVEAKRPLAKAGAPNVAVEDMLLPSIVGNVKLEASSVLNPNVGPDKLLDGNPASVWHRDPVRGREPSWLEIDFGRSPKAPVRIIKAYANPGQPDQMFKSAYIQGSRDKRRWFDIADLTLPESPAADQELSWHFENKINFRYYRLTLAEGFIGGVFNSMGELGLFSWPDKPRATDYSLTRTQPAPSQSAAARPVAPAAAGPPTATFGEPSQWLLRHLVKADVDSAEASSHLGSHVPGQAFDGNPQTVWHVDVEKIKIDKSSWLKIDLGPAPARVVTIKVTPNSANPGQMFRTAIVEGSEDAARWTQISTMVLPDVPGAPQPLTWHFSNSRPYRYYRLQMVDGYAGGAFLSLGEIELFKGD